MIRVFIFQKLFENVTVLMLPIGWRILVDGSCIVCWGRGILNLSRFLTNKGVQKTADFQSAISSGQGLMGW